MWFLPRMPWRRRTSPLVAAMAGVGKTVHAIRQTGRRRWGEHSCFQCGAFPLRPFPPLLVCGACGWEIDWSEYVARCYLDGDEKLAELRRAQWMCLAGGVLFPLFGAVWFWWLGEWPTLLAALFVMVVAFFMAALFRFRWWMIVRRRLFDRHPPWRAWLREEFSSSTPDEKQ